MTHDKMRDALRYTLRQISENADAVKGLLDGPCTSDYPERMAADRSEDIRDLLATMLAFWDRYYLFAKALRQDRE